MKLRNILTLCILIITLSCDNELDVNADWKDVTVIYGALNPNQDTNYIRVQRGYLGNEPARNSFDKPDSLYYDESEIEVVLNWYEINGGSRGELVGSATLPAYFELELNSNGPFTTDDYRIYRITEPIQQNYEYEVVVSKPNEPDTYASTRIVESFDIKTPFPTGNPPRFSGTLQWDNEAPRIAMYEPHFFFYYKEYDIVTKQSEIKMVPYEYEEVPKKASSSDYKESFSPVDPFFVHLANRIPDDPNKLRFFERLDFRIWGVDEEILTYMNLHTPSEGINQSRPQYTNVTNGIGIFGSRINVDLTGVILNEAGTPSFKDYLQVKNVMCSKRFASVRANGDTCICNPQAAIEGLKCPY